MNTRPQRSPRKAPPRRRHLLGPAPDWTVTLRLTGEEWVALAAEAHGKGISVEDLIRRKAVARRG